jgi:hypothetical protein
MGFTIEPYVSRHQRTVMGKTMAYIDEGHGECHPLPAWQPHLVISVTQHHAAPGGAEPARRLRSAGYGRIRQTQCIGPQTATPPRQPIKNTDPVVSTTVRQGWSGALSHS